MTINAVLNLIVPALIIAYVVSVGYYLYQVITLWHEEDEPFSNVQEFPQRRPLTAFAIIVLVCACWPVLEFFGELERPKE